MMNLKPLCLICLLALIYSCQVQKRKYQKGFYVGHSQNPKGTRPDEIPKQRSLTASASRSLHQAKLPQKQLQADSCDVIEFTDGTQIKGHVVELNARELQYYYCDEDGKNIHVAKRATVVRIAYANGSVEQLGTAIRQQPAPSKQPDTLAAVKAGKADSLAKKAPVMPEVTAPSSVSPAGGSTTGCDRIVFRDGSEEPGKVFEIGISEIRYKNCSMPEGPDFIVRRSKVFMIVFPDGQKEVFPLEPEPEAPAPPPLSSYQERKGGAITAFVFSILGLSVLFGTGSLTAIIMSAAYLKNHRRNPRLYPADKLAKAALVIGIVPLAILAIVLITFLL